MSWSDRTKQATANLREGFGSWALLEFQLEETQGG